MLPPIQDESQQTEKEVEIVNHVKSKVTEIRAAASRIAHEGIWMTNIAYTLGYHGITFNTTTRSFQPINRVSPFIKKDLIHVNKILPKLQNRLSRLCKNAPKFDVRPESNDTEDKEAARLALQILQAKWDELSIDQKRLILMMWVQQTGHGYVKVGWDPTLGDIIQDPMTGESDYQGDLSLEIVSPFEVFPDPLASSFEEVKKTWLIQAKVRKVDYFKSHYPGRGEAVKAEEVWLLSSQYQSRINSMNTRGPSDSSHMGNTNCAIELAKYEARSKEYPNGRLIITANGILLEDKELPCGEIPFEKFDDVIVAGKYYSESVVTHARPIQDQYNAVIKRRSEWTRKLLAGKYATPKGSGLQQESMNDGTEVVYYTPVPTAPGGGQPVAIQVPNIPQWAYNEENALDSMLNDIFGLSEVSQGTLPSASIPALGMQILEEADTTRIGIVIEQHERAWARVCSLILKYVEEYYSLPRKLKIAGKNLQYTIKTITGEDLKGNTDVTVIRGSSLPKSEALKRQDILNAFGQGLLGDQQDPKVREKVLGMIEFGDIAEVWEEYGLDMHQIKRGMDKLEKGEPVTVSEFDNHALWLSEMNKFRKGDKFETLPEPIQALFLAHMEERIEQILVLSGQKPPEASQAEVDSKMQQTQAQDFNDTMNPPMQ